MAINKAGDVAVKNVQFPRGEPEARPIPNASVEASRTPARGESEWAAEPERGRAFAQKYAQNGPVTVSASAPTGTYLNDDIALRPLRSALNRDDRTVGDRAQMLLGYRNQQLIGADRGVMEKMKSNDPSMPVYAEGPKKGMAHPLYEKLADDPKMQNMMLKLSSRINSADPTKLDIQKIFKETQADAVAETGAKGSTAKSNLMALQAMATLGNYYMLKDSGLPPEVAQKLPQGLWDNIKAAGDAWSRSTSKDAAVMSQDAEAGPQALSLNRPFSADHNFHFFSHAYLTASLVEKGLKPEMAKAVSGFIVTVQGVG